jgi:hypothetical protein
MIQASKPRIDRAMKEKMAEAAAMSGSSGAMVGSPYQNLLGQAAGEAAQNLAEMTLGYENRAAENYAGRKLQSDLADQEREYNAWAQQGSWDQAALDRSLSDWQARQAQDLQAWEGSQNRDLDAWSQWGNWQFQQQNDPRMAQLMQLIQSGMG